MKKLLALLLAMLFLCACGKRGTVPEVQLPQNQGMYDLGACFPDQKMQFGDQHYRFEGDGVYYTLMIRNCLSARWTPPLGGYEVHTEGELTYYSKGGVVFWDGVDEKGNWAGGKDEINEIVLVDGNFYYVLEGYSTSDRKPEASIDLLLDLLANQPPEGLALTERHGYTRLLGEYGECNVSLSAYDEGQWAEHVREEQMEIYTDGGISYIQSPVTQVPSGWYVCEIICGTDEGLLQIRSGVPEDDPAYLSIERVRTVAKELGVTLTDVPQAYLDLYE